MALSNTDLVTELYIGYFNRAPDPAGMQSWLAALNAGATITQVANAFANSSEAKAIYPYLSLPGVVAPDSFVDQVYLNVLNRPADAAGRAVWIAALKDGRVTAGEFILKIEEAVNNQVGTPDALTLANKVTVAEDYLVRVATSNVPYTQASAKAALAPVTSDPATVAVGEAVTTAYIAGGGGIGSVFTLKVDAGEQLVGTAGPDTFNMVLGAGATLNAFDNVNGNGGLDTANIISDGTTAVTAGAIIASLETVKYAFTANPAANIDAAAWVGSTEISMTSYAAGVDNIKGQTISVHNAGIQVTDVFTADTGTSSVKVVLDAVTTGSYVEVAEEKAGDLKVIDISGSVVTAGTLNIVSTATKLGEVDLAESSTGTVTVNGIINGTEFQIFNASKSTGGLTIDFDVATVGDELRTVSLGSGKDVINWDQYEAHNELGGITRTLDLGAGDDKVTLNVDAGGNTTNTREEITLGAGHDLVYSTNNGNIATATSAANVQAALVVIKDFSVSEDTLQLTNNTTFSTLTNVQLADIAAQTDLLAAANKAATYATASHTVVFDFQGSAYVFDNDATATFGANDELIQLIGVTSTQLNGADRKSVV